MAAKRSDGIETKHKLLEAAGKVFAAVSFHDAKVADICREAGANVAAVNYYFGSKEALYVEAWQHAFDKSIELYPPDGGVPENAAPEERLRGSIRALVARIMDPASLDFDIAHREFTEPTGLLAEAMHTSIDPLRAMVADIVRKLLGPKATDEEVNLCEMSIHSLCFASLRHKRHKIMFANGHKHCSPCHRHFDTDVLVEHICTFSLAGIDAIRQPTGRKTPSKGARKKS